MKINFQKEDDHFTGLFRAFKYFWIAIITFMVLWLGGWLVALAFGIRWLVLNT